MSFKNEVSPAAAKRILEAIKFKLFEHGLKNNKDASRMATGVAALVKRIVLEDVLDQKLRNGDPSFIAEVTDNMLKGK